MQRLYLKFKDHWQFLVLLAFGTWCFNKLLDWLISPAIIAKIPTIAKILFEVKITIHIVPLLIALILLLLIYRIRLRFKIAHSKLKIISAQYGAKGKFRDITEGLNSAIRDNALKITIDNNIAGDPFRGELKKAIITYELNGQRKTTECEEYQVLTLG